jgi:ring-1,2-phenylacetyl-CoA epoxidase subunit PaaD
VVSPRHAEPGVIVSRAWSLLAEVADPELPALSIVDLGIVREVDESADGRRVSVTLTPTYSGCPATEVIARDVETVLAAAYDTVEVRTVLSPAWSTDELSRHAGRKLTLVGIAPPSAADGPASCPVCGSTDVEQLATFGSTPCKALWRCRSCREPFDHFKRH